MKLSNHLKGLLITGLGVFVITPDGLLTRLIAADVWTLTFWRGLLSAIGMGLLLFFIYRKQMGARIREIGWPGLVVALMFGLGSVAFVYAITHTTVANTLLLVNTSPMFAALIAWGILHETVLVRTWIVIVIVLIGVVVIAFAGGGDGGSLWGNLAALWAALSNAISLSVTRRYKDRSMVPAIALGSFVSALVALPLAQPGSVNNSDVMVLLGMGLIMLPLSFALMFIGPRYIPAPEVSLMMLLESLLGPLWVWLALSEAPGVYTLIGGTIIVTALAANAVLTLTTSQPLYQ